MSNILAVTYEAAFTPTRSDTVDDPKGVFAAFYVGGTGDVKVHTMNGQDITFFAVQAGTGIPIAHTRVWSSVTSATNIVCLSAMPYKTKGAVQA